MSKSRISVLSLDEAFEINEPDWIGVKSRAELNIIRDLPENKIDARNRLGASDCIIINSLKSVLDEELIRQLPILDLIICPQIYKDVVNLDACAESDINVEFISGHDFGVEVVEIIEGWLDEQVDITSNVVAKFHQNPKEVFDVFISKDVKHLYHANTLATSITFIEEGALLSRGFVEAQGLFQTSQPSDGIDNEFGIWDDVFLDGIDIHAQHSKPISYGPVLFLLKPELLNDIEHPLMITRFNPKYWKNGPTWRRRYLYGVSELSRTYKDYTNQSSKMMLTVRNCEKTIDLSKYLTEIVVDTSHIKVEGELMGDYLRNHLRAKLDEHGLSHVPVNYRHNSADRCLCFSLYKELYKNDRSELKKRVLVKPKD